MPRGGWSGTTYGTYVVGDLVSYQGSTYVCINNVYGNTIPPSDLSWSLFAASGYTGISGYSGFTGYTGYSGFSGESGYSGYSGYTGYSGTAAPLQQTVYGYSNTFTAGQVIYRTTDGNYALALADDPTTSDAIGVVQQSDGTNFTYIINGYITYLSGLYAGVNYYLSDVTPGALTNVPPTALGSLIKPILTGINSTDGIVVEYPAVIIDGISSGTSGYYSKWVNSNTIGDGILKDDNANLTINGGLSARGPIYSAIVPSASAWNIDVSDNVYSLARLSTVAFNDFSGILTVNCWGSGSVEMFLCGSGSAFSLGKSGGGSVGSVASNGNNGYTFTADEAGTQPYTFFAVRTRPGA